MSQTELLQGQISFQMGFGVWGFELVTHGNSKPIISKNIFK